MGYIYIYAYIYTWRRSYVMILSCGVFLIIFFLELGWGWFLASVVLPTPPLSVGASLGNRATHSMFCGTGRDSSVAVWV